MLLSSLCVCFLGHDLRKPDRVVASKIEKKRDPLMQRRVKKKKGGKARQAPPELPQRALRISAEVQNAFKHLTCVTRSERP